MVSGDQTAVLVVDDDEDVLQTYRLWLTEEYDLRTASSGESALETIDETTDVVLLDRRMPGTTGDEILAQIREAGYDCQVVLATAIEPDFDVLEMDFDAYLTKALDRETVVDTIERLQHRSTYDDRLQEYFTLAEKRALLTDRKSKPALAENEDFQSMEERLEELETTLESMIGDMDDEDFLAAMDHIESNIEEP